MDIGIANGMQRDNNVLWIGRGRVKVTGVASRLSYFAKKATLTYLLTLLNRVLLQKLTGSQLVKKFPAFYGTRRFITAFTSAQQLSLT